MNTSESLPEKGEWTRFRLLYEAGKQLGQIADPSQLEEAYDIIIRLLEENNEGQPVIHRFNADSGELVVARVGRQREVSPVQVIQAVPSLRKTCIMHDVLAMSEPPHASMSLVITPIEFKDDYYGTLALSYAKEFDFADADIKLIEGLAQQLAITIHRLVCIRAQHERERRAGETSMLNLINKGSFALAHKLANQLPLVRNHLKKLKNESAIQRDTRLITSIDIALDCTEQSLEDLRSFRTSFEWETLTVEEPTVIPVSVLLDDATRLLPVIPDNVQFRCLNADEDARVRIVPKQIVSALYNLMANAIEAMPNGGKLLLEARSLGAYVEIKVTDSGVGISSADQKKIFNLFYSTKKSSGFGLWSARLNTRYNGGDLLVTSDVEKGTSFTITLPREP